MFFLALILLSFNISGIPHYYVTACDSRYFRQAKNLIGSIHANDINNLGEIAVFDLGMSSEELFELKNMYKVFVYEVEPVHPDLLKDFIINDYNRVVKGHFAWKPVVIKQALDKFPYILYLDAGHVVLTDLDNFFEYINEQSYFFVGLYNVPLRPRFTNINRKFLSENFSKDFCEFIETDDAIFMDAAIQGLNRNSYVYVNTMYNLAKNLELFADDKSCPLGFGEARHDQTLSSIIIHSLRLKFYEVAKLLNLSLNSGKNFTFKRVFLKSAVDPNTNIFHCRNDASYVGAFYDKILTNNNITVG